MQPFLVMNTSRYLSESDQQVPKKGCLGEARRRGAFRHRILDALYRCLLVLCPLSFGLGGLCGCQPAEDEHLIGKQGGTVDTTDLNAPVDCDADSAFSDSSEPAAARNARKNFPSGYLNLETPTRGELAGGDSRDLTVELARCDYAHVRVEQLGADLQLNLYGPDGELLTSVDSPTGNQGFEEVFVVAQRAGRHRLELRSLDPPSQSGDFVAHLATVHSDADETERHRVSGTWSYARAEARLAEGKHAEALALYQGARGHFRKSFDPAWEGRTWQRSAQLVRNEDPLAAADALNQALSLFRQAGEKRLQAITLAELGSVRFRLGEVERARTSHQAALELFELLDDPLGKATALNNLGLVHKRAGEILQALECYRRAVDLWRELKRAVDQLSTEINLGKLLLSLGKLPQAQDLFESCLESARASGDRSAEATCLGSLGDIEQRRGRYPEALKVLKDSLNIYQEDGSVSGQGVIHNSLGNTYLKQGQPKQAGKHYQLALDLFEQQQDAANQAVSLLNLGRYHFAEHRFIEAAARHREALALYRQVGNRSGEAATLLGEARSEYQRGRLRTAEALIGAALATVELLRQDSGGPDLRVAVVASKSEYWELYVHVLMALHREEPDAEHDQRALEVCERWRARSLLDLLREARLDLQSEVPSALAEEERALRQRIAELYLQRLEATEPSQHAEQEGFASQLRSLQLDLELLNARIHSQSRRYGDIAQLNPVDTRTIQRELLRSDTQLVEYFLGQERSYAWLVSRQQVTSVELPPRQELEAAGGEVSRLLQTRSTGQEKRRQRALQRLSSLLLEPLADALGASGASTASQTPRRLLVVGDGILNTIPFSVLPLPGDRRNLLIDKFEVVHLPSASVLAALRDRQRRRPIRDELRIALFADPIYQSDDERLAGAPGGSVDSGAAWHKDLSTAARDLELGTFQRLPHTRVEVEEISRLFSGNRRTVELGFAATRSHLLETDLKSYSLLHFATHGVLNRRHPSLSGLVLSLIDENGDPQDGFLRLQDIYNLRLEAELVTLSACQTGLGAEVRGEGLIGLTRGFMYAGSPRVLVSLWRVDDAATAELMKRFYRELLDPKQDDSPGVAAALRRAQLSMREESAWTEPFYWAGFVLQGEWRQFQGLSLPPNDIGQDQAGPVDRDPDSDQDMPTQGDHLGSSGGAANLHSVENNSRNATSARRATQERESIKTVRQAKPAGDFLERFLEAALAAESYDETRHDPPEGIEPRSLAETGWGVIFAEDTPPAVRHALNTLLDHRQRLAGRRHPHYYQTFTYRPGTSAVEFLSDARVPVGETGHPDRIPYYLLLVGSPSQIPFQFQFDLDLQYAVGRLDLANADQYREYALTVVEAEEGRIRRPRQVSLYGARGDQASRTTAEELVAALAERLGKQLEGWQIRNLSDPKVGTKEQLGELLGGSETPAILFASAHGLRFTSGHALQRELQGSLVSSAWAKVRGDHIGHDHIFSAGDLSPEADLQGLIAFFFTCYGAGTPRQDTFFRNTGESPAEPPVIAPEPFTSRLAQSLLGRPGGALAVVSHVERTWTSAFQSYDDDQQIESFHSTLRRLMAGHPVGSATSRIDLRRGQIAAHLRSLNDWDRLSPLEQKIHDRLWQEYLDARNFIVLGDPAVAPALGGTRS